METAMDNAATGVEAGIDVAAYDRSFDGGRAGYLGQVNDTMLQVAGVRYLEVAASIHPGAEAWKDAYDRGVSARKFVDATMQDFGFVQVGKVYSREDAASFNKVKAAMCEFSLGNSDWIRGADGSLFHDVDGGIAMMKPVRDRMSGRFGFGIEYREGASLDKFGTRMVDAGKSAGQFAGFDMAKALDDYASVQAAKQFRF